MYNFIIPTIINDFELKSVSTRPRPRKLETRLTGVFQPTCLLLNNPNIEIHQKLLAGLCIDFSHTPAGVRKDVLLNIVVLNILISKISRQRAFQLAQVPENLRQLTGGSQPPAAAEQPEYKNSSQTFS